MKKKNGCPVFAVPVILTAPKNSTCFSHNTWVNWSDSILRQAKPKKGQGLMDKKEKRKLSESDICDLFISPAIRDAGWDPLQQIRREVTLTPGPVIVRGNMSSRNKKKKKFAANPTVPFLVRALTPVTYSSHSNPNFSVPLYISCTTAPRVSRTTPKLIPRVWTFFCNTLDHN